MTEGMESEAGCMFQHSRLAASDSMRELLQILDGLVSVNIPPFAKLSGETGHITNSSKA